MIATFFFLWGRRRIAELILKDKMAVKLILKSEMLKDFLEA